MPDRGPITPALRLAPLLFPLSAALAVPLAYAGVLGPGWAAAIMFAA